MVDIPSQYIKNLYKAFLTFLIMVSLFFAIRVLSEFQSYNNPASKDVNTITLTGHGQMQAVPDIANISFTITKDGKTVKEAQAAVVVVEKNALDFLKTNKVADKDIQTTNASFNPKYNYTQIICPQVAGGPVSYDCINKQPVIVGYTAYESINVKLRVPDDAGKIMQGLGTVGVADLNGPNFAIDNEDGLKAQARKKAIDDASTKAKALASDLGVSLGHITSFSEGGNYPIMYANKAASLDMAGTAPSAPAVIPKGENTISSDVTVTYEIR